MALTIILYYTTPYHTIPYHNVPKEGMSFLFKKPEKYIRDSESEQRESPKNPPQGNENRQKFDSRE